MPIDIAKARTIKIVVALFVAGAGALIATYWNYAGQKTIVAGKIEVEDGPVAGGARVPLVATLQGSFTVSTPLLKIGTIQSQGTGGACLIADLNPDLPTAVPLGGCNAHDQCQGSLPTGWSGYCDKQEKKCWVRPDVAMKLCNRSIDVAPGSPPIQWQNGVKNPVPRNAPAVLSLLGPETRWRVYACLNRYPQTGAACGTHLEMFGPPVKAMVRPRLP